MDDFLDIVVTGDKTWVYHYKLESKWQSLEWRHMDSQTKREFKVQPSIGKIMFPIFLDFLEWGCVINSAHYMDSLKKL
jgi:hypothetical protein